MKKGLMRRACAYNAAIITPVDPRTYTRVLVTIAQNQEILVQKTENELTITESGVLLQLTQNETLAFRPSLKSEMGRRIGSPAYLQIRAYTDEYDAPGSENFEIDVIDSLSEEVLSDD